MSDCRLGEGPFPPVKKPYAGQEYARIVGEYQSPFTGLIERHVRAIIQSENDLLEEYCERSLVDPAGRGVFVERWEDHMTVRLSADVPWATIHTYEHHERFHHDD